MGQFKYLMVACALWFGTNLVAVDDSAPGEEGKTCPREIASLGTSNADNYRIIPSGRDPGIIDDYREAAEFFFGKDALVSKLGLANPPHVMEWVPSAQLNVLASLGRHAVVHWHDGAEISRAAKSAGGVLEFVTPGLPVAPMCPVCRSFYSDTTKKEHQLSVIMHVVGHNDFAAHSMYCTSRACDPIAESLELSNRMAELYRSHDHDEVARWYQFLLSMSSMQDLSRGTFDDPAKFRPGQSAAATSARVEHSRENVDVYATPKHPRSPTPSILQAFVENLSPTTPEWQRDIAQRFERMQRVYGFYTSNKIMNEGWATLMQELLPGYTPYSTSHHSVEYADLMRGVAYPSLSNPYWLGRECWRIVRKRFEARPEVQGLPRDEMDRRFIDYAHREIIATMNDFEFVRFSLDEQWIHENNLILSRPAKRNELDRTLPPPKKENQEQKIVLSRDYKRIVNYIARKVADRTLTMPQIWLHDFNGLGIGAVDLRHHTVEEVPLERKSAAQTLFVISQVIKKPVSLITVRSTAWEPPRRPDFDFDEPFNPYSAARRRSPRPVAENKIRSLPIRIEVHPNGNVKAFQRETLPDGEISEVPLPGLTDVYQEAVDEYRIDLEGTSNEGLSAHDMRQFGPMVSTAVDSATTAATQLISHAPTSGHALLEFANILEWRIIRAMRLAAAGKLKIKRTKRGVVLKVLPSIPEFALDRQVAQAMLAAKPPAPMDPLVSSRNVGNSLAVNLSQSATLPVNADDDVDLGQGNGKTGDKFWGDSKQGGGGGKGDPEEGDPDDGDPDKGWDSGEPIDPTEIEIPHDLFAKFLLQEFELPNLRRNGGQSDAQDTSREGGVHRPNGNILWERTVPAAINYAIDARRRRGKPYKGISQMTLLREGMKYIHPSDYVVSDSHPSPRPDVKALIVYVIDLTGSMSGRPQELAKEWVSYVDWLIGTFYKDVTVRFVGYSDSAFEFKRNEIFKAFIGGGNTDSTGFLLAKKIITETQYPDGEYDKYVFGIGDGGSYDVPATPEVLKEIYDLCRYSGWVQVMMNGPGAPQFMKPIHEMTEELPWFGYTELHDDDTAIVGSIKPFFKKEKKE